MDDNSNIRKTKRKEDEMFVKGTPFDFTADATASNHAKDEIVQVLAGKKNCRSLSGVAFTMRLVAVGALLALLAVAVFFVWHGDVSNIVSRSKDHSKSIQEGANPRASDAVDNQKTSLIVYVMANGQRVKADTVTITPLSVTPAFEKKLEENTVELAYDVLYRLSASYQNGDDKWAGSLEFTANWKGLQSRTIVLQKKTKETGQSLVERLAKGRKLEEPAKSRSAKEIEKRLRESLNRPLPSPVSNKNIDSETMAAQADTPNYAEEVVRPYIQLNWRQPSKDELDVMNPTSVEVSFTVLASGSVVNAQIEKESNSRVLNRSVLKFLLSMRTLPPLSSVGSKSSKLTIHVTMTLDI